MSLTTRQFSRRFARRSAVTLGPLVVAMAVLPALTLLLRSRLPTEAAISPDGTRLPWTTLNAVTTGWLLLGTVAQALWLYRHRSSPVGVRRPAPFSWAAAAATGVQSGALVAGNLDRVEPSPLHVAWVASPLPMAVIATASAVLGWFLAGGDAELPAATARPDPSCPRVPLVAHVRTTWCRPVLSGHAFAMAALLTGLGISSAFPVPGIVGALAVALAVVIASHATAVVRVDQHGVAVVQSLSRRTLIALPYDRIEQATAAPSPTGLPRRAYGVVAAGPVFGYRSRPTGPALRLAVAGGRECVLTIDDPETAAALINARIDHRWATGTERTDTC